MPRVAFHSKAEAEVDAAFDWYWERDPQADKGFLDELSQIQSQIGRNPQQFLSVAPTLRKAILHRYPYYLLFRQNKAGIEILVVAHAKRRPNYWKSRT